MLIHSPIAISSLLLATLGHMFQDVYHFSPRGASLEYLSLTFGFLFGQFVIGPYSDAYSAVFAVGYMCTFLPSIMHLVDTYTEHAASAICACTVVQSVCEAFLPLAAGPLYQRLGYGWGNSLPAFVALAFVPFTIILARYGESIRLKYQPKL
ncbi:hypothetical protein K458DRAFT_441590 [Lentithecium fluviatile CBS 122367]|uniref:MFS general substrate transporter n=1 Tax=Lentithecium fluviatile CBS 122367 TaxID=1168545 RepID=A0A6G1J8K8_9PLEO|nr:hypothetical protein K458DRAFT_441590 [Lentithecium fluviatile CBS 122367]